MSVQQSDDGWVAKCYDCGWVKTYQDRGTGIPPRTSAQKAKAGHVNHFRGCRDVEVKRPELEDLLIPE